MTKLQMENLKLINENIELNIKLVKAKDLIRKYNQLVKKLRKREE